MTAPEPLTMTLEEGLASLFPDTIGRRDDGKWPFFTYMNDEHGHTCTAIFDTWPEAVSWANGVPVVARDDAAELKAAAVDWAKATKRASEVYSSWMLGRPNGEGEPEYTAGDCLLAQLAKEEAEERLYALAASVELGGKS